MIGLRDLWGGYLRIGVSGPQPERLVNLIWIKRLNLWDLQAEEDGLSFCISVSDLKVVRRLQRQSGCQISILEKHGARFPRQKLVRKRTPIIAALIFLISVYVVTGFVWTVELDGGGGLPRNVLLDAISEMGIFPGAWKGSVDLQRVERGLLIRFSQLAWAGIRVEGTRVIVQLVERVQIPDEMVPTGDLVADADGIIDKIMVFRGQAMVEPGDTVTSGQVLVARAEHEGAQAVVQARVWYEAYAEASRVREDRLLTGRVEDAWMMVLGDRVVHLGGPESPPYTTWEEDRTSWVLGRGRKSPLPVEFIKLRYYEIYTRREVLGVDRAREEALRQAREQVLSRVMPEARVIDLVSQVVHETENVVGVRVLVEVAREIGQHRPAEQSEGG